MIKINKRKIGFTLVEVMISITLLVIVFASVFGVLSLGNRIITDARNVVYAGQIMQNEIEGLRGKTWTEISNLPAHSIFEPTEELKDKYKCYRIIKSRGTNQKEIYVFVTWNDNGKFKQHMYNSLFTENGLYDYYYYRSLE